VAWLRCAAVIGDIETCAAASDGASLIPSPTIITLKPSRLSVSMRAIFGRGHTRPPFADSQGRAAARTVGPWRICRNYDSTSRTLESVVSSRFGASRILEIS